MSAWNDSRTLQTTTLLAPSKFELVWVAGLIIISKAAFNRQVQLCSLTLPSEESFEVEANGKNFSVEQPQNYQPNDQAGGKS